jgi:hypothetical protein
VSPDCIK